MSEKEQQQQNGVTKRGIVHKIAEVMAEVERVPKTGHNSFHNYDYATEADIAQAVRQAMAARGMALIPTVEKMDISPLPTKSGSMRLCTIWMKFTLEDGDSGETRSVLFVGEGSDGGDKAVYKAMTGAEKYALMKLFLIPTGDDPEKDEKIEPVELPPPPAARHPPARRPPPPPPAAVQQAFPEAQVEEQEPSEEPPPPLGPPPRSSVVAPFGNQKGQMLSQHAQDNLDWLERVVGEGIRDPAKSKYKKNNQQLLAAIQQEQAARRAPRAAPQADDDIPF